MTKDRFLNDTDKDFGTIPTQFVDDKGICKACGHYHGFRPKFEDVKTSIDIIPQLFRTNKVLETV